MEARTPSAFPNPTEADQARFLIRAYFGPGDDWLSLCVRRAYLDFHRTLHGVGSAPAAFERTADYVRRRLRALPDAPSTADQLWFDGWHQTTCSELAGIYRSLNFDYFHVGQAQKWINMSLKYVYVMGEARLPGFARFYEYCHIPIDNVILMRDEFKPLRSLLKGPWSRLNDYPTYLEFQRAVRASFQGSCPLATEFWLWP